MKIKALSWFLLILIFKPALVNSQVYVNRVFQESSGSPVFNPILNPLGIQWSKSITLSSGYLLTVGHTNSGGQEDIFVGCYDSGGNIIFQQNYDFGSNEYGTDVCEALNGDLLICGTADNNTSTDYDVVILRISSSGTIVNFDLRAGTYGGRDFAVGIVEDVSNGDVFVAANTETGVNLYDYWAIKYNNALSYQGENFYDYTGLNDLAIGLAIDPGADISIIGASQGGSMFCDYALASFDCASMTYNGDSRSSVVATMLDQPLAFCRDAANNTYITGQSWNGSDYDVKTIRINSNMTIGWQTSLDLHGKEDAGTSIALDPVNGDIIIGGYATKTNNKKEMLSLRYNGSTGAVINSPFLQSAEDAGGDALIKAIGVNAGGDVYFAGGEKGSSGKKQVIVGKISAAGMASWQRKITNPGSDLLPSDLEVNTNKIYAISVLQGTASTYITTEYSEFKPDTARTFGSNGKGAFMKRQLLVRFKASALDTAAIDNHTGTKISEYGALEDFMTPTAYAQLTSALDALCGGCTINAAKVFPYLPTTYTSTTSRLGETIPVDDFWTTLLLEFPATVNLQAIDQVFNTRQDLITYSHPNFLGELASSPSDTWYGSQFSLHSNTVDGINVEEAWDIVGNALPSVRVGVFDSGVQYQHEDFAMYGSTIGAIKDGWDFVYNCNLRVSTLPDGDGHGTCVTGIIGAGRDDSRGIAGVAGGVGEGPGISLYSLNITAKMTPAQIPLSYAADAILTSCFDNTPSDYDYKLNLMNHSWRFDNVRITFWYKDSNIVLFSDVAHQVNRLGVTFVAARGNEGINNHAYPANIDDDWILTVGGTGTNGQYAKTGVNSDYSASYGDIIDVSAPSSSSQVYTTRADLSQHYNNLYGNFNGTSAAAPHVTGVVALMMSYINDTTNSYNNMAPEDCEFIIQKSATDVGPANYDSLTGFGRLNAGAALRMIKKPYNTLRHFGTNNSSFTMHSFLYTSDTIHLTDPYKSYETTPTLYDRGKYVVKVFQIDANVIHNISTTDSVSFYWPRPSSSAVLELLNPLTKQFHGRERVKINSCNATSASLTGYVYQVWDSTGSQFKGWWPCDTTFSSPKIGSLFEYSILSKNMTVGIKENKRNTLSIDIFPNPAHKSQTIRIETVKVEDLKLDLYDLTGRMQKNIYSGKTNIGGNEFMHDVENLPNSMYIYVIKIGDSVTSKKFIKE